MQPVEPVQAPVVQGVLFPLPVVGVYPVPIREANALLEEFGHYLGPVHRPFRQEGWALQIDGRAVAVAVSASIVNGPVAGLERGEVVEMARLAASERWASRVMLRLWRECCAPRWAGWPVRAAVAYSQNARHDGSLYRFDGWRKVREDAGSSGGGTWGRKRGQGDEVYGRKTLWLWRYP